MSALGHIPLMTGAAFECTSWLLPYRLQAGAQTFGLSPQPPGFKLFYAGDGTNLSLYEANGEYLVSRCSIRNRTRGSSPASRHVLS
jgi:hypothetical protein